MNHQAYVDALVSGLETLIKDSLIKRLVSIAPIFASGPLGYIASYLAGKIAHFLAKQSELRTFFLYTDVRSNIQGRAFLDAAIENRDAQLSKDPDRKKNAEKLLIDKFRTFAKF